MIIASEAARIAEEAIANTNKELLDYINMKIQEAATLGKFELIYAAKKIPVNIKRELEKCGYRVYESDEHDQHFTTIRW